MRSQTTRPLRRVGPAALVLCGATSLPACTAILGGFDFEGPAVGGGGTTSSGGGGSGGMTTSSMGGGGATTTTTTTSTGTGGMTGGGGTGGAPVCTQGQTQPCYTGPLGTEGKGICKGGVATCLPDGTGYGSCDGEVLPGTEDCKALGDEDCDGVACSEPLDVTLFDNSSFVSVLDMAVDAQGNVLLAGRFTGSVSFGGKNLIAAGAGDYFLVKTDTKGTVAWAKQFGDASDNGFLIRVAVNASNDIFLAGELKGSANFGAGTLTSAGAEDVFAAKLDSAGNHKWSKLYGDTGAQVARAVAVDPQGDAIIGGSFGGSVNFGGGAMSTSMSDAFIAKLAGANGAHLWSKQIGETSSKPESVQQITSVAADAASNVVVFGQVGGSTMGSVDIGPGFTASTPMLFVGRFDSAGNHSWSSAYPVTMSTGASRAAVDTTGAVVLLSNVEGTVNFGGGALTGAAGGDLCLAGLTATGAHAWSKCFPNTGNIFGGVNLTTDAKQDVIFIGTAAGAVDLGGGPLVGTSGTFLGKLDKTGNHLWSKLFSGTTATFGNVAAMPVSNDVLYVGSQGTGDVDYGTGAQTCTGTNCTALATFQP